MAKKTRNLYNPLSPDPFKVSRTGIELFIECPRCFYLDKRKGIGRPPGLPFNLNSAVDALLKKEFDQYRIQEKPHPLMVENQVDAIPFTHPELEKWRTNFTGIRFHHIPTNLLVFGAVDDVWINSQKELIVVDYKSTAKNEAITSLDQPWHAGYKRQLEVYQWLLRQNGFSVSPTCYWVYANGDKSLDSFEATLRFRMTLISYQGKPHWIEKTLENVKLCLDSERAPQAGSYCQYCSYVEDLKSV